MVLDSLSIIQEIGSFLRGHNEKLKYLVNVETNNYQNFANCIIHEPGKAPVLHKETYKPFLYLKDLKKAGISLYGGNNEAIIAAMKIHQITVEKLRTDNHKRLEDGFCIKVSSDKSYGAILEFLRNGGLNMWERYEIKPFNSLQFPIENPQFYNEEKHNQFLAVLKKKDKNKKDNVAKFSEELFNLWSKENNGDTSQYIYWYNHLFEYLNKLIEKDYKYKHLFYTLSTDEQFFISTGIRLFKGIEQYKDIHKVILDIETTGLKYIYHRVFLIGIKDNRGFEIVLKVNKLDDDEEERNLIKKFFATIDYIKPAVIEGYHSEDFDFDFILGRAKILGMGELLTDRNGNAKYVLNEIKTTLDGVQNDKGKFIKSINRIPNSSVKFGNSADKYTATNMWGYSIIDILHAVKRTAAVNTEIKNNKLKYISKFEGIAKPDRMYIDGERIYEFWKDNKIFIINPKNNNYERIPLQYQNDAIKLVALQNKKRLLSEDDYKIERYEVLKTIDTEFIGWLKSKIEDFTPNYKLIEGKDITERYLLDDLWETEKVDELYNQSSFLLAKIVPTSFSRVCTMGNAAVWNLLMTTWSYEKGLAIPIPDVNEKFSGGLARCYKKGFNRRIGKLDFGSLYPMLQLTYGIFPLFDLNGVIKKMLLYMSMTRNIYKNLANGKTLKKDQIELLKIIDETVYNKVISGEAFTGVEKNLFKVKQLPIKIINNSLFGALGSAIAFNWSDNLCASRITCSGRIHLREMIMWFKKYDFIPLLAVTDGVNFTYPEKSNLRLDGTELPEAISIEEAWVYEIDGKILTGFKAIVEKFNNEIMPKPFMSVDLDGTWQSSLNLSRINYANLTEEYYDEKKGKLVPPKIKLTGNTIKSKVMPEYIEEFIDKGLRLILEGNGEEFVEYYNKYLEKLYYKQIPLKKIASKKKYKYTINEYLNRGTDKNGRKKAKMAYMELVIDQRNVMAINEYNSRGLNVNNEDLMAEYYANRKRELLIEKLSKSQAAKKSETEEVTPKKTSKRAVKKRTKAEIEEEVNQLKLETIKFEDKLKKIYSQMKSYLPNEPELDSYLYFVNVGTKKGNKDSGYMEDANGNLVICASIINNDDLENNADLLGDYNVPKYVEAFNKRVVTILEGFDPNIRKMIIITDPKKREYFTKGELELKAFDADSLEDSLYLEDKELEFWNRTGLNPYVIWNGFKLPTPDALSELDEYNEKVAILNRKLQANNDSRVVKSVNDELKDDDLVLYKNFNIYDLYHYKNGNYVLAKHNVFVPVQNSEYDFIEFGLSKATIKMKQEMADKFKEMLGLPIERKLSTVPNGLLMLEEYIRIELEKQEKEEVDEEELEEEYED